MIDYSKLGFRIEGMHPEDVPQVIEIEHVSFTAPWSAAAYERELLYNDNAYFFVARPQGVRETQGNTEGSRAWLRSLWKPGAAPVHGANGLAIVGYGGFWLMAGEAHIMTIAVKPEYRGRHVGELLLAAMIDRAYELNATEVTLEVRVSNHVAQALYRKYGFLEAGRRIRYYSDNNEDALIMTTNPLRSASYRHQFEVLRDSLSQRLAKP